MAYRGSPIGSGKLGVMVLAALAGCATSQAFHLVAGPQEKAGVSMAQSGATATTGPAVQRPSGP